MFQRSYPNLAVVTHVVNDGKSDSHYSLGFVQPGFTLPSNRLHLPMPRVLNRHCERYCLNVEYLKINKHATEEEAVAIVYLVREFSWCDANGSLQANIFNAYIFYIN